MEQKNHPAAGLTVVECPYCYAGWTLDQTGHTEATLRPYEHPRAADYCREAGAYEAAGLPVTVTELDHRRQRWGDLARDLTHDAALQTAAGLKAGDKVLFFGGYCNYAPALVGGIQAVLGPETRVGLIWLDAHADNRVLEEAEGPVRFVALPMSMMTGQTAEDFRREVCLQQAPVAGSRVLMADGHQTGPRSMEGLLRTGARVLSPDQFAHRETWAQAVRELADQVDVLYLSVDGDILDFAHIPAYHREIPGGQDLDTVIRGIRTVLETGKVAVWSLFCMDFDNPDPDRTTAKTARRILEECLPAWR